MQKTNYPTNVTDNQWKAIVDFFDEKKKENENTATEKSLTLLFIC